MIHEILTAPNPILRRPCRPVEDYEAARGLAADIMDTALSVGGLGLAAPQIGVTLRAFALTKMAGIEGAFINPEIMRRKGGASVAEEACLSIPGKIYRVRRYRKVRLSWFNLGGRRHEAWFGHLPARVIQHEMDHLDGLMIDDVGERVL